MASNAKGDLYVGDQVSTDGGKTFHNYIRWDNLLNTLKDVNFPASNQYSIKDINPGSSSKSDIEIEIETETAKVFKLSSPNSGKDWTLLESKIVR